MYDLVFTPDRSFTDAGFVQMRVLTRQGHVKYSISIVDEGANPYVEFDYTIARIGPGREIRYNLYKTGVHGMVLAGRVLFSHNLNGIRLFAVSTMEDEVIHAHLALDPSVVEQILMTLLLLQPRSGFTPHRRPHGKVPSQPD